MSLWLRLRDKKGVSHLYLVPFAPPLMVTLVALLVATLLPLLGVLRATVIASPDRIGGLVVALLAGALLMLATAKCSLFHAGHLLTFGPRLMSRTMQCVYFAGYVLLVIGGLLTLAIAMVCQGV